MTGRVERSRVARKGHPFLIGLALLVAAATGALQSSAVAQAATSNGYRLAGIVAVGADYLGFLELPEGGQILVRQGSVISGGGRVVALDGEGVRIAFADRTIQLDLEGTGGPGGTSTARDVPRDLSDEEPLVMHEVSPEALAQLSGSPNRSGKGGDAGVIVAQRFATLARLPQGARVHAVNEQPVQSADATIRWVEKTLAAGGAVSLKVTAADGPAEQRVYLMPVDR